MPDEDWGVMLAKKASPSDSELPTRPFNSCPAPRFEALPASRTHLMLVRAPGPTPRGLAWAHQGNAPSYDAARFESMLRLERLNLG